MNEPQQAIKPKKIRRSRTGQRRQLANTGEGGLEESTVKTKSKGVRTNRTFGVFLANQVTAAGDFIRNRDLYGQPINLNYQGDTTYKTMPGGCLSLVLFIAMLCYSLLKANELYWKQDWQLIQQQLASSENELGIPHHLGSDSPNRNISVALQFSPKRPRQTVANLLSSLSLRQEEEESEAQDNDSADTPSLSESKPPDEQGPEKGADAPDKKTDGDKRNLRQLSEEKARNITQYFKVSTMVEKRHTSVYSPYDQAVNPDIFTWRLQENSIRINIQQMYEIPISLEPATIMGAEDFLKPMDLVKSRFQVRLDEDLVKVHAFATCKETPKCNSQISQSVPSMVNEVFSVLFYNYEGQSAQERVQSTETFKYMQELAVSTDPADQVTFFETYYATILKMKVTQIKRDRDIAIEALTNQYIEMNGDTLSNEADNESPPEENDESEDPPPTEDPPPEENEDSAPAEDTEDTDESSSEENDESPPAENDESPPTENGDSPPAEDSENPPAEDSGEGPPAEDSDDSSPSHENDDSPPPPPPPEGGGGRRLAHIQISQILDSKLEQLNSPHHLRGSRALETVGQQYQSNRNTLKTFDSRETDRIDGMNRDIEVKMDQSQVFQEHLRKFREGLKTELEGFEVDLIVYDEVEHFREWDDPLFYYPYKHRKNLVSRFQIDMSKIKDDGGYKYPVEEVRLQRSVACLEPNVFNQLDFVSLALDTVTWRDSKNSTEEEPDLCEDDAHQSFEKLKFIGTKSGERQYLDDYELGVIKEKILLEFSLEMDAFKTKSTRKTTEILDFLGDLGGFYQALDLILFLVAEYFSARFFLASIANSMYLVRQKKEPEVEQEFEESKDRQPPQAKKQKQSLSSLAHRFGHNLQQIRIRPITAIIDPLLGILLCPLSTCCKRSSFSKRQKLLSTCEEKFTHDLEITGLLSKIREANEVTKHLRTPDVDEVFKYSKDRVIDLESNQSSSDDGEERDALNLTPFKNSSSYQHEDEYVSKELASAVGYSAIRCSSFSEKEQAEMMKVVAPPLRHATSFRSHRSIRKGKLSSHDPNNPSIEDTPGQPTPDQNGEAGSLAQIIEDEKQQQSQVFERAKRKRQKSKQRLIDKTRSESRTPPIDETPEIEQTIRQTTADMFSSMFKNRSSQEEPLTVTPLSEPQSQQYVLPGEAGGTSNIELSALPKEDSTLIGLEDSLPIQRTTRP